jgi:hypothetical protein
MVTHPERVLFAATAESTSYIIQKGQVQRPYFQIVFSRVRNGSLKNLPISFATYLCLPYETILEPIDSCEIWYWSILLKCFDKFLLS